MKIIQWLGGVALSISLAACGGGGGSSGAVPNGQAEKPQVPAALEVDLGSKSSIANSGSDFATLTVTVINDSRVVMPGVPVSVSLSPDGVFQASSGSVTDANGRFVGKIGIGSNKSNRIIKARVAAGGLIQEVSVLVTGSQISITPAPATPVPGQEVTLNITARDIAGVSIPNANLVLSGTAGLDGPFSTDVSGNVSVRFSAPKSTGSYSIVVTGLGISATRVIKVVSGEDSGIPAASGVVGAASLMPNPTSINANLPDSTANRATLKALFQSSDNVGISNMRVRFEIVGSPLGSGEAISTGAATVYSNASGEAVAEYIAGTRTSPTNGVVIRACYSQIDFASSTECPNSVLANLTVAGTPLSISISDNNELAKGLGGLGYVKKFLIQVNDSRGGAVAGAVVSTSVDITHYGKGLAWGLGYANVSVPTIRDFHSDYTPPDSRFLAGTPTLTDSRSAAPDFQRIWCLNEDFNRNGFLDVGEDLDGDGGLDPRKAEIIVSYVNGNVTDSNGQLLVQITYGQNMGGWLAYTLRATTGVVGSEGDASRSYVTDVLQDDVKNGAFLIPPFGSASCHSRN